MISTGTKNQWQLGHFIFIIVQNAFYGNPRGFNDVSVLMLVSAVICVENRVTQAVACKSELKLRIISVTPGYKDCRPRLVCIHWGYRKKLPIVVYPFSLVQQKTLSPLTNLLSVSIQLCCAFHWHPFNNICSNSLTWKCNSDSLELLDWWCCPKLNRNKSLKSLFQHESKNCSTQGPAEGIQMKEQLMQNERQSKERRRWEAENGESLWSDGFLSCTEIFNC